MIFIEKFTKPYELSEYNSVIPHKDGWLLHSQMSGALVLLNEENKKYYDQFAKKRKAPIHFLKMLKENGFLKKKNSDEREQIKKAWDITVNSSKAKALTVVTTDRCNLGCTYCYEKKTEWRMMDEDVQNQVKDFITRYLTTSETSGFGVTWFGGEPTLNMNCIENLSAHIKKVCDKNKIPWHAFVVTNGTTLKQNVIDRLKKCNVDRIQITLDGFGEQHDLKRPYLRNMKVEDMNEYQIEQRKKATSLLPIIQPEKPTVRSSSFDDIIQNLELCYLSGFQVSLRVNVDDTNKDSVLKLYEYVYGMGWMKKNKDGGIVRVYTHQIFDGCSTSCSMKKEEYAQFEASINRWTQSRTPESYRKLIKYTGDTCTANKKHQFVVNPSGHIIKCWHHATDDSHSIGHISELSFASKGTQDRDRYHFSPFEDKECVDCHVLPICLGGCKVNNKFDSEGYSGQKEQGCITARWNLKEEIIQLYEATKRDKELKYTREVVEYL